MKKVLVVDDEKEVAEFILEVLLEEKEFEATAVYSAHEAIKMLVANEFHLVITDVIMPEINGLELTEHIFNNYPDIKVLACSGGGESGKLVAGMALDQALEEGADNALLKPFSSEELLMKVRRLI